MIMTTDSRNGPAVHLRNVLKTYEAPSRPFTALHDITLSVPAGEFVAVVGKSGSGKTTLLNVLAGIDRPSSGEISVGDTPVHVLSESQLAEWRGRTIGLVFQFFQLLPTLTVAENVMLPRDFVDVIPAAQRRARAVELLERVASVSRRTSCRRTCQAGSNNGQQSPERSRTIRRSCVGDDTPRAWP
jgi:putative ABC transport system ATP-binding protein